MNVSYRRLEDRAPELGTHFKRHYLTLERHLPQFLDALGRNRVHERLDLWRPTRNPRDGFKLIRRIASDNSEGICYARTYFAVQHILLILAHVDTLKLSLASGEKATAAYHRFIVTQGNAFIRLSTAFIDFLTNQLAPSARKLDWALLGVGTLRDQDDIDVALVDDGSEPRESFNTEMARVAHEMLRSASPLHFYLAEKLQQGSFSIPLEDYVTLVDKEWHDHVLMSEVANTTFLLGSRKVYEEFMERVVHRYFRERGTENPYHEVFVRGLTGEIRSMLLGHLSDTRIHPKNDALRIIKMLVHVFWSIHGVKENDPWKVLSVLSKTVTQHKSTFRRLRKDLSFLETLRTLFQLFSIQEEEISVSESADVLERIAETMGYSARGVLRAHQLLLVDYYEHVHSARDVAQALVEEIRRHLQRISPIHKLIRFDEECGSPNLARAFMERLHWYPGNRYWADALWALEDSSGDFIRGVARDYYHLEEDIRDTVVDGFLAWARDNLVAWITFTRLLAEADLPEAKKMREELNWLFLDSGGTQYFKKRLAEVFHLAPRQFHHYIDGMSRPELIKLRELLAEPVEEVRVDDGEEEETFEAVTYAVDLYLNTSRFFSRNLRAVAAARPEVLERLSDGEFLADMSQGLRAESTKAHAISKRKELLVLYFRVEYLRVGLLLLSGTPLKEVHRQYTEYSDVFLSSLYRLARKETEKEVSNKVETRDRAAIFTTGGRGREEAFDDDIDMVVFTEGLPDEANEQFRKTLSRMNQQIMRLGIIPQYRMAEHFREYFASLDTVKEHLLSDKPNLYLDMTEFLELRMVEGNAHFAEIIRQTIVEDILFDKRRDYLLHALVEELEERRGYFADSTRNRPQNINIKEYPGGQREIELVLIYHKVMWRLHDNVNMELFDILASKDPQKAPGFSHLKDHFVFLKRLRHLNRILISADDVLRPEIAHVLAPYSTGGDGSRLIEQTREKMATAAETISSLMSP